MADNLFELLNAPTSLKPKDLATHIRMQVSLPEETRNNCSRDLFRMDIKLMSELTTCRYGRKMPKEEDPEYLAFCEAIAFKGVEPIPYRFFASEFAALKAQSRDYKAAVSAVTEPWRVQAYAAQYLRMAQNAETGKPESASQLWHTAVRYYKKFFAGASVEESYSFQFAPDDDAREACRRAWNDFLKNQIEALVARRRDYISRQNTKSAEACLKVLSYKEVKAIVPDAYDKAVKEGFAPYVSAIKSAATLDKAGEMYKNCPKTLLELDEDHELEIAMLTAIGAELNRRKAVKGPAKAVPVWLEKLEAKKLYTAGAVMVKIEAKSLYEACADYVRFALESEDADILQCACDICAADNFPDDVFIGKSNDGDLYRPGIAPILVGNLTDALAKKMLTKLNATSAANFAQKIIPVCRKLGYNESAYAAVTRAVNYMGSRKADPEIILAYLRKFNANTPLQDPNCPTVEALIRNIEGDPGVKLLKELAETSCTNSKYPSLVDKILDYVKKNGDERVNGESFEDLARRVLLNEFVGCANQYQSSQSETLMNCLKKLAQFLKYSTQVPTSGEKLTVGDVMKSIQGSAELESFKKLTNASTGSREENAAVKEITKLARSKGSTEVQGTTLLELAQRVLINTYVSNANAYQSNHSSCGRETMHIIADFLPADTKLPGAGKKTVREFDDQIQPLQALSEIQGRIQNESFTESDIMCLSWYVNNLPDFDLGGKSFREVANSFLHAMLVVCANNVQRRNAYGSSKWGDMMVLLIALGPAVPKQESEALFNIIQHFNISFTKSAENTFSPLYKPFGKVEKHGGGYGGGGGYHGGGGGGGSHGRVPAVGRVIAALLVLAILALAVWGITTRVKKRSQASDDSAKNALEATAVMAVASSNEDRTDAPTRTPKGKEIAATMVKPTSTPKTETTVKQTNTPKAETRAEPTTAPTAKPTAAPTAEPTTASTAEPTAAPTAKPTAVPTASPTAKPTAEPTSTPTTRPTMAPTAKPTATPTMEPNQTQTGSESPAEPGIEQVLDALGEEAYRGTYEALLAGEIIQKGSKGEAARGLQQTLIAFGQSIVADGNIGPKSIAALNSVQQAHGLEATEMVDAEGYALLLSALLETNP
ncbi:MAG: hypothetical protein Q4C10_09040 [Clostridia bacterium]|nr:hypothetical protein [Clostridia bacterium]